MKQLYSIGEVSSLLGVSAQTLRFYSNGGLIQPRFVDPKSGYRFFSYDQFHIIDRIKYLQGLGFSLTEIKEALQSGKVEDLLPFLESHRERALEEMENARRVAESLQWYLDYYQYLKKNRFPGVPFKRELPARYLLAADCLPGEDLFGPGGYRLTSIRRDKQFEDLNYLRQHGYILDFNGLMEGEIRPKSYFVYLKDKPTMEHDAIREIPPGQYLCFRGKILINEWDSSLVKAFFKDLPPCEMVVADEYEDNLREFISCTYEIQLLLE